MQRAVDNVIAITKESVKTFTYEFLNNIVKLINGISALLLAILPGKTSMLEGLQGWELRPTFRAPRFPRWMGNGVSSFNHLIHELSTDSDTNVDYFSAEEDSDGYLSSESPKTPISRVTWASSVSAYEKHWTLAGYMLSWLLFPFKLLLGLPSQFYCRLYSRENSSSGNQHSCLGTPRRLRSQKDHFVQHATDRRRGVIEDLHVGTEVVIEAIFDVVFKAAHFLLSPFEAFRKFSRWAFLRKSGRASDDSIQDRETETEPAATLGEDEPTPAERKTTFHPLNTDARTCQDVITELGYPYEAIRVVTDDGYILLLERIPRRDSRKAVCLQHGVFDSSMGWVSNGIVGSPAFAAFDQGYDVFLGNFRGLVSREHINKNFSSKQYWRYSINEHATKDIPAMIEKIHEVKTYELKLRNPDVDEEGDDEQAYNLCAICHSLGGAAILMYVITRRIEQKPHRLSRLILLSPAGFHDDSPFAFTVVEYMMHGLAPILAKIVPAFYIPTRFFRMLLNKLARDFHNYPAVGGLVQTVMGYFVGGDSSNWVGVLGLPHYNMNDMPGVSFCVALHLAQMKRTGKFRMFDYGSPDANMRVYGRPEPLDFGERFYLIDIPVDLVAGRKDTVIRPSMVKKHYNLMKEAGVEVSYNEFKYAHLDFTFSHHEELLAYVLSRLRLVKPILKDDRRSNRDGSPKEKDVHEIKPTPKDEQSPKEKDVLQLKSTRMNEHSRKEPNPKEKDVHEINQTSEDEQSPKEKDMLQLKSTCMHEHNWKEPNSMEKDMHEIKPTPKDEQSPKEKDVHALKSIRTDEHNPKEPNLKEKDAIDIKATLEGEQSPKEKDVHELKSTRMDEHNPKEPNMKEKDVLDIKSTPKDEESPKEKDVLQLKSTCMDEHNPKEDIDRQD